MLIYTQGQLGKDDGIKGTLDSGDSLAHVNHALIISSMATYSPGHRADILSLARHLLMPR